VYAVLAEPAALAELLAERGDLAEPAGSSAFLAAVVTEDTGGAPSSRKRMRH
jgi:hypothetical protein